MGLSTSRHRSLIAVRYAYTTMQTAWPICSQLHGESLAAVGSSWPGGDDTPMHCSVQVFEGRVVEGENRSGGHVITATSGSGSNKQSYNYATERIVGNGSFGVVFQATCLETAETVRCCKGNA